VQGANSSSDFKVLLPWWRIGFGGGNTLSSAKIQRYLKKTSHYVVFSLPASYWSAGHGRRSAVLCALAAFSLARSSWLGKIFSFAHRLINFISIYTYRDKRWITGKH
jgi:hypothetical protein